MTRAELQELRDRLHDRAYQLNGKGLSQAAQALWAVVEELDGLLNRPDERRH